jgi:hypothetical protein
VRVRPLANRLPGADALTAAAMLRSWRPAPGRSHSSLHIAYVAVMIHLIRGAGERLECPSSSLLPRSRANFADDLPDDLPASACRLKPLSPVLSAGFAGTFAPGSPASTMLEPKSLTALRLGAAGRQLRFVHVETSRRIGAGRAPYPCVRSGRRAHGSGPFRTPWRAPPEDGYGGKRWTLLGRRPPLWQDRFGRTQATLRPLI